MIAYKINTINKYKERVYIYDVQVDNGVKFYHKGHLTNGDYFAVLSFWSPIALDKSGNYVKSLSDFGSWYVVRKNLFKKFSDGSITCKGDYMHEKLAARTQNEQRYALERIKKAYQFSDFLKGRITHKIKKQYDATVLKADFETLGKIVLVDRVLNPKIKSANSNSNLSVVGKGTQPWGHISQLQEIMKEFRLGKPSSKFLK